MAAAVAASVLSYLYFAITLTIIARKTSTSGGWMAWLPPLNLFLMCQIGRRSLGWLLLLFIPCLNVVGIAVLFGGMAEARGKSPWLGALVFVPVINLLLPAWLAMGQATPGATWSGPRGCPRCGAPASPGDGFCGNCGQTLAPVVPMARPATASSGCGVLVGIILVVGGVLMLGCCGVGGFFLWYEGAYSEPTREEPALPPRLAGTMTALPLDDQTVPTSVLSQNLEGRNAGQGGGQLGLVAETV